MEDFEFDYGEKNDQETPKTEDINEEDVALAKLLKKAKEDEATRNIILSALGAREQAAQAQPAQPAEVPQPRVDEDEQRLNQLKKEQAELRERLKYADPESQEFARMNQRLAELEVEILKLEPKVMVKQALTPIQQQQAAMALQGALMYASNALFNNPRLSRVPDNAKREAFAIVEQALGELYRRDPASLLNATGVQSFVDALISRKLLEVLLPAPADPGYNSGSASGNTSQLPPEVRERIRRLGLDEKEYLRELEDLING